MKKFIFILSGFLFVVLSHNSAFALSDEMYKEYMEYSPFFAAAEKDLNQTWKELKALLTPEEYKSALAEQRAWLKQRDKIVYDANNSRGAALKADSNLGDDFGAVTNERVEVLKARIAKLKQTR